MKKVISTTFHFERHPDGNAPDESGPRREIEETTNLLGLAYLPELTGPEARAITAMTAGFTIEQFVVYDGLVARSIRERRERHATTQGTSHISRSVLAQTEIAEKRWAATREDLEKLVRIAKEVRVTGLEPNSVERRAAAENQV